MYKCGVEMKAEYLSNKPQNSKAGKNFKKEEGRIPVGANSFSSNYSLKYSEMLLNHIATLNVDINY